MMQTKEIHILCSSDSNYLPYCGVMMSSLLSSNTDCHVHFFILISSTVSNRQKRKFDRLISTYDCRIDWILVDNSIACHFPQVKDMYWTVETYYRLFAADLLPDSVHRVLYLDCDIIVDGSLSYLWDVDISGFAVGVVHDIFYQNTEIKERLSIPLNYPYFNAGVLLMNLDYWRNNGVCNRCLDYIRTNQTRIFAEDQDVLNAVLFQESFFLPLEYNFQIQFWKKNFYSTYPSSFVTLIEQTKPIIVHYASPIKPWGILYYKMPYLKLWHNAKTHSPFRCLLPQLPKKKKYNYLIKRFFFWPLGLMWSKEYL